MPPKKNLEFDSYYTVRAEPMVQYQQIPQPAVDQFSNGPCYPNYQPMTYGLPFGIMGQIPTNAHPALQQQGLPAQYQNYSLSTTPFCNQSQSQMMMLSPFSNAANHTPQYGPSPTEAQQMVVSLQAQQAQTQHQWAAEQQQDASVNCLQMSPAAQVQLFMRTGYQQPPFPVAHQPHLRPSARAPRGRSKEERRARKVATRAKTAAPSTWNGVTEEQVITNAAQEAAEWQHTNGHVGSIPSDESMYPSSLPQDKVQYEDAEPSSSHQEPPTSVANLSDCNFDQQESLLQTVYNLDSTADPDPGTDVSADPGIDLSALLNTDSTMGSMNTSSTHLDTPVPATSETDMFDCFFDPALFLEHDPILSEQSPSVR